MERQLNKIWTRRAWLKALGAAGRRQVEGARLALQHNLGLGGFVVTLYERV